MKKILFLMTFLWCCTSTFSQIRKYSNESLNIGIGARALGMASAFTAMADDITAAYWNPAGLTHIMDKFQVGLMHNEYFGGIGKYDYIALGIPINTKKISSVLALSYSRFGVDNIPNTFNLVDADGGINYDNVTFFSQSDNLYLISYAWRINKKTGWFDWADVSMGANAKIINRKAGPFAKSWGMGIDLAAQYTHNNIHAGVIISDVTTTYNAWSFSFTEAQKEVLSRTNNVIPINTYELTAPSIRFGGAYDIMFSNNDFRITPSIDLTMTTDKTRNVLFKGKSIGTDPAIGFETGYKNFVFVRLGINNFTRFTKPDVSRSQTLTAEPNIGLGLNFKSLAIDYAFTNVADRDKLFSHVISARIAIKQSKSAVIVDQEPTYDYQKEEVEVQTKQEPNLLIEEVKMKSTKDISTKTTPKPTPAKAVIKTKEIDKADFLEDKTTPASNKAEKKIVPTPTQKPNANRVNLGGTKVTPKTAKTEIEKEAAPTSGSKKSIDKKKKAKKKKANKRKKK